MRIYSALALATIGVAISNPTFIDVPLDGRKTYLLLVEQISAAAEVQGSTRPGDPAPDAQGT
jgi:hypothetical protein